MSSSIKKDVKFSVKAVINKQKTKVLFAEIDRDFADILISFLTMPLGQIFRVLENHHGDKTPVVGSLENLYRSLSNLDGALFRADGWKQVLLNPESSLGNECRKLKLDIADTQPTKFFICENWKCPGRKYVAVYHASVKCDCGKPMTKELSLRTFSKEPDADDDGVFGARASSFILSDDFEILPNSTKSVRKIVRKLGLIDANGTECRNLTFGFDEILFLLLTSMCNISSPLTYLVLGKMKIDEQPLFQMEKIGTWAYTFNVKVIIQESTTKVLFVEADERFVDFLFSMLVIPLGKVEYLLGGNTGLKNIDNLYRSISLPINSINLRKKDITKLINPTIPYGVVSTNNIFPLCEELSPKLYYHSYIYPKEEFVSYSSNPMEGISRRELTSCHSVMIRKCEGGYVRGPMKFMVKDDLTVTPLSMSSYISTLNELKIPFSDVDELTLKIGMQEALSILKASLSSRFALSKGLSHLLVKLPKQGKIVKQEPYCTNVWRLIGLFLRAHSFDE